MKEEKITGIRIFALQPIMKCQDILMNLELIFAIQRMKPVAQGLIGSGLTGCKR